MSSWPLSKILLNSNTFFTTSFVLLEFALNKSSKFAYPREALAQIQTHPFRSFRPCASIWGFTVLNFIFLSLRENTQQLALKSMKTKIHRSCQPDSLTEIGIDCACYPIINKKFINEVDRRLVHPILLKLILNFSFSKNNMSIQWPKQSVRHSQRDQSRR